MTMDMKPEVASTIESALREGATMHAFRSGGGLRVVRVENGGNLIGYGEHPAVSEAFRILADDIKAGGREYGDVYGKTEDHYLTGSSSSADELDAWLRQGSTFDACFVAGKGFAFELRGYDELGTPDDIVKRVVAGEVVTWSDDRGVVLESCRERFANGEFGCSTSIVSRPAGVSKEDVWMWRSARFGTGPTLAEAIAAAFAAERTPCASKP